MTETLDKRIILNKCACGSKVNTNLKCGDADCQEFICPKCMIQTKTVPKCRKCAKLKKNPAFNPTPKELILSFVVCSISSIVLSIGINAKPPVPEKMIGIVKILLRFIFCKSIA